jgi:predicted outer membrane repeat protein
MEFFKAPIADKPLQTAPVSLQPNLASALKDPLDTKNFKHASKQDASKFGKEFDKDGSDKFEKPSHLMKGSSKYESPKYLGEKTLKPTSITFIDTSAPDYEFLRQGVQPGTEVHLLDATQDAIAQITRTLAGRSGISSLNIVSHGDMGSIDFASLRLNQANINQYSSDFSTWAAALTADADILLYGCDIAASMKGETFVQQLSQLTGADIAASDDLTGSAKLGGDWTLEFSTGKIETADVFQPWAQAAYEHVLATFAVTNTNDSGAGSLRQAILNANQFAGADEIVFKLSGSGMKTIALTSGQLEISDQLFISGLGRNKLTISGNNISRVFQVNSGVSVTMRGLTIADGQNDVGGGIRNAGRLEIRDSAFRNNNGANGGAIGNGIFAGDNTAISLTLDNVQFTNNSGSLGGAINNLATATIRRSTFSNNVSSDWGGAVLNQGSATMRVERSTFTENSSFIGGGIANNGQMTVRNSTFRNNQATSGGGIGTAFSGANTIVEDSTFSGNTATRGGGIYNFGTLTVNDSNFTSNTASTHGGGIYTDRIAIVSYSSFKSNTAAENGGGIYNAAQFFSTSELTLEFSTLENNQAANGGGVFNGAGGTARVKESQIRRNTATIAGPDLNGVFISEGGNEIGNATGSTGFVNGLLSDRIG